MHLSSQGSTNRRTVVQAGLGIKWDPISKITNTKRAGGVAQVVEHLPSKFEALSSNPNYRKKKKGRGSKSVPDLWRQCSSALYFLSHVTLFLMKLMVVLLSVTCS
jgi:hypothetical protein